MAVVDEGDRLAGVIFKGSLIAGLTTSIEPSEEVARTSPALVPVSKAKSAEKGAVGMVAAAEYPEIPLDEWTNSAIAWIIGNFGGVRRPEQRDRGRRERPVLRPDSASPAAHDRHPGRDRLLLAGGG